MSMEASEKLKKYGRKNDLIERMIKSDKIMLSEEEIHNIIDPTKFTGRSALQVEEFITGKIEPILQKNQNLLGIDVDLKV